MKKGMLKLLGPVAMLALLGCKEQQGQSSYSSIVVGPGAISCGNVASRAHDPLVTSWAMGYLSGLNVRQHDVEGHDWVGLPDRKAIERYIDNHCRANPLHTLKKTVDQMFSDLEANKL